MRKGLHRNIIFEDIKEKEDMFFIKPSLLMILSYTSHFCEQNNIKCVITDMISTLEDDARKGINRVSTTHAQGRAFDLSISSSHGWTSKLIKQYENDINLRYSFVGAKVYDGNRDLISRPIVVHNSGYGVHAHLQVRP